MVKIEVKKLEREMLYRYIANLEHDLHGTQNSA
jgi:hypothetical protein